MPKALELDIFGGSAVLSVTAGCKHSAAVTAAGELWTWGDGYSGCIHIYIYICIHMYICTYMYM